MIRIYAASINQPIHSEQYQQMLSYISEDQRLRMGKFRFESDKKRMLYGSVMSRYFVGEKMEKPGETVEFELNSFGKPYVKETPLIQFNVSHSGEWVVCAVGDHEIGVDIEQIKPIDTKIAQKFFTQTEYQTITFTQEEARLKAFYRLWTMKESYIKYIGQGLSIQLDSFEIVKVKDGFSVIGAEQEISVWQGEVLDGYMLSLCHTVGEPYLGIQVLDIGKLICEKSVLPLDTPA